MYIIYSFVGSTGFLGSFFLSHLLKNDSDIIVHCLVRCDQESEGIKHDIVMYNDTDLYYKNFVHCVNVLFTS